MDRVKSRRIVYGLGALFVVATLVWTGFQPQPDGGTVIGIVATFVCFRVGATLGDKKVGED